MLPKLVERSIRPIVAEALSDARAVCVLGARQTGKSTLVKQIAEREHPAAYITLDDDATRRAALEDPTGFVAGLDDRSVIDEVQRAPDLMLAIKARLDTNDAPGQFLLTGSANILTLSTIVDKLPGRVDYVRLWPFSQGEIENRHGSFIDRLFDRDPPRVQRAQVGRGAYAERIVTGGFPRAQGRSARIRERFFESYVATVLAHDLEDVARVRRIDGLERLPSVIASRSANLMSTRAIGVDLGIDNKTAASHVRILEELFLVWRLQPWHSNLGSRYIKTPKLYVTDSGLLAHLMNADTGRIVHDAPLAGQVFETFVAMELLRQKEWSRHSPALFHYRDSEQREIDVVMELRGGAIAGVEVKTAATITSKDFAGLRYLRDKLGERFSFGVVLYTGERTLPFGDRLAAVPLCGLWQS
jgi:predicted AAA+ superfamily ATPase